MSYELNYKAPGPVAASFIKDRSFVSGIRGPVGSGKSVSCCIKGLMISSEQEKDQNGLRRSRAAIVRNTNPELKTTTIKTWLEWFPEHAFGKFVWSPPYTHRIRVGDVELEAIFIALDTPEDVKKLLSLEITWGWINEAREVPKAIVDALTSRVGRFPSKKDGPGAVNPCVFMDTNAPEERHWWPIMAGEAPVPDHISPEEALMLVKPKNWTFFNQPGGMLEVRDQQGHLSGYVPNPDAENRRNLRDDYYPNMIQGKTGSWIGVYVLNKLGAVMDGKPVYQSFSLKTHVAKEPIPPVIGRPVEIGMDFGLTPAAVITQRDPRGRRLVLGELVAKDMGIKRFVDQVLKPFIAERFKALEIEGAPKFTFKIYGDPAGDYRAQTDEETPFRILRAALPGWTIIEAPSNDPALRIEAVELLLTRLVHGDPGILIDPSCRTLLNGFTGGYHYRKLQVTGMDRFDEKPMKNEYSHVHDALQYVALGTGEGRALMTGPSGPAKATVARRDGWDAMNRRPRVVGRWNRSGL